VLLISSRIEDFTFGGEISRSLEKESIMRTLIGRFRQDEDGAALVEYGMLVGLIAVICVLAVTALGTEVSTAFSKYASALAVI